MCLQVLFKGGESASGVLSSPSNQFHRIWAKVAKLLQVAEIFSEDVNYERYALLEVLERDLLVDDGLARGIGHAGGYFLQAVACRGGAKRLAFVFVGFGEDDPNKLAYVPGQRRSRAFGSWERCAGS